jgi:hypothetical protein
MVKSRKQEPQTNGTGKGRIKFRYTDQDRTLDFSMENVEGESVTEGLRSLANALAGRTIVGEGARNVSRARPELVAPAVVAEEEVGTQVEQPGEEELEIADGDTEIEGTKPKRVAKPKAPKLLSNLKLTDAKVPLAEFMKQKGPVDMMDKYGVVAVWLKENFEITEISIDHIFTAFKHLGIDSQLPTDVAKPLNNLAYNRKWFDRGKAKSTFKINWVGESEVTKMGIGATK